MISRQRDLFPETFEQGEDSDDDDGGDGVAWFNHTDVPTLPLRLDHRSSSGGVALQNLQNGRGSGTGFQG